jgi:DNA invertase Pin-like site-specific DNA recombinase/predicted DNA-binding transcriptional regulator AlpA
MSRERLIEESHLQRKALVYVRQSTPGQVLENRESTRLQYQLRDVALELGWGSGRIETIDEDLGVSGSGEVQRGGFERLTLTVARGEAGAVFGLEASRLSRNEVDWFQLLRWLRSTDTLIVVEGRVYDPGSGADALTLGLQGTLSANELYNTRRRMEEGQLSKAQRGQLYKTVPTGYVREGDGLRKDPDPQVRHAIGRVFELFREVGTARQVVQALRAEGMQLPSQKHNRRPLVWSAAGYDRVYKVLTNPLMGGAYVYGRQRTEVYLDERNQPRKKVRRLPQEQWRVLLEEHHEGYVSWEEWQAIQAQLKANSTRARGAPREGRALLQGLAVCGECGRALQVRYGAGHGYLCRPSRSGAERGGCLSVGGQRLDAVVAELFLEAVRPAGVEAALRAERLAQEREDQLLRSHRLELERRQYEERRAKRNYVLMNGDYKSMKQELMDDWHRARRSTERAQQALEQARERLPRRGQPPSAAVLARLGLRVQELWAHPALRQRDRKRLLATLLEEAVLRADREAGRLRLLLRWRGGWIDERELPLRRRARPRQDPTETVELVRRLARLYSDERIVATLTKQGRRTARGLRFTQARVRALRQRHGIAAYRAAQQDSSAPLLGVAAAAGELGVAASTLYRWIEEGFVAVEEPTPGAPWLVRVDAALRSRLCESVPAGFVAAAQARKLLGVSRQTLWERIRSGQLEARRIVRGPQRGLYVQLEEPEQPQLHGLKESGDA